MQQFDTAPVLNGQFKQGPTVYPLTDLIGTAIVMHMYHKLRHVHKLGKGTVVITDATNGAFRYSWHKDDTSMEGLWDVWVEVRTTDGPLSSTNVETLEITKRKSGYSKYVMGRMVFDDSE